MEVWVQGVLAGTGTVYTYAKAVQILGAARAAIFPALISGLATLMGWPVLGHIPTLAEAIGLTLAIVGLLVTVTHSQEWKIMNSKPIRIPGPDHPMSITPTKGRVTAAVKGRRIADT